MSTRDQIQQQMTAAMKAGDKPRTEALRFIFSQLKNKEIDLKRPLTDEETEKLLQTEAKRRREAIAAYQQGGREDLAQKEQFELSIIESYLPQQLSDEELMAIVSQVKAANPGADFGTLMRETMKQVAGRAEGGRVAKLLNH